MQFYIQNEIFHTIQGTETRECDHAREDYGPGASKHRSPEVESDSIAHADSRLSMRTHERDAHVVCKARTLSSTTKYATFARRNSVYTNAELIVNNRRPDVADHLQSRWPCSNGWPLVCSSWHYAFLRQHSWPGPSRQTPTDRNTGQEHNQMGSYLTR